MTERHIETELCYHTYVDYEEGNDVEDIHYPSLFKLLTELVDRIEELEKKVNCNEKWRTGLQKVAKEVSSNLATNKDLKYIRKMVEVKLDKEEDCQIEQNENT